MPRRERGLVHSGMPPWHMWGSDGVFTLPAGAATQSQQLARVSYRRPETWHMFFFAEFLNSPDGTLGNAIYVMFDLTIGVGRSVFTAGPVFSVNDPRSPGGGVLPGFANLIFPSTALQGQQAFTNVGRGANVLDTGFVTPVDGDPISEIVAQDIQVNARVAQLATLKGPNVIRVGAFFAPKNHVRPDWFEPNPAFMGDEVKGR